MKANDIINNIVKDKLKRDEVVASMTVRLVRGIEIARLAASAGFDMIYIDLEHSTLSLEATGQICQAALGAGVTPMVRVPANTPEYIQRVLDAGALGIIAPGVRSIAHQRFVSSVQSAHALSALNIDLLWTVPSNAEIKIPNKP